MKFIELTYYRHSKGYGIRSGKTDKHFQLNPDSIVRITEYTESLKLTLTNQEEIEICENFGELKTKIKEVEDTENSTTSLENLKELLVCETLKNSGLRIQECEKD